MNLNWLGQPDTFRLVLWLLSPLYVWFVKLLWKKFMEFHSYSSERAAKLSIIAHQRSLENPPSLLTSVAYIVCFLPIPIALVMTVGTLHFAPYPMRSSPPLVDEQTAEKIISTAYFVVFLVMYLLFGSLAIHGVQVAYRLRHGEALYVDTYKAAIQKKIDRIKKQFPNLQSL